MEEILASIRRIIADDDTTKSPQAASAPESPAAQPAPIPAVPPRNPVARPTLVEPNAFDPPPPPPAAPPEPAPVPPTNGAGDDVAPDILELTESMTAAVPEFERARPRDGSAAGSAIPYHRWQLRYQLR